MNNSDIKLIIIVIFIISIFLIIMKITSKEGNTATVYYEDKIILTIDLTKDKEYTVKGYQGDVVLEVKNNKIRVKEENSYNHICSKEGYISESGKSLICLPNKIIIKIDGKSEIDGVVY